MLVNGSWLSGVDPKTGKKLDPAFVPETVIRMLPTNTLDIAGINDVIYVTNPKKKVAYLNLNLDELGLPNGFQKDFASGTVGYSVKKELPVRVYRAQGNDLFGANGGGVIWEFEDTIENLVKNKSLEKLNE